MKDITVLIVAFNAKHCIKRALESALQQSVSVIVVDDCSSDGTAEYVESLDLSPLKLIKNPTTLGLGGSRQIAINYCDTEYAVWLDADDMLLPGRVQFSLANLRKGADYVFDSLEHFDGEINELNYHICMPDFLVQRGGFAYQFERNYIPNFSCAAFKVESAKIIGYNTSLKGAEDYDHFLRALLSGYMIKSYPIVYYRQYSYTQSVCWDTSMANVNALQSLNNIADDRVLSYFDQCELHPAELKWIWCNYLIRQHRFEELLTCSEDFERMIVDCENEKPLLAPLPYSFQWKATFSKAIALLSLNKFAEAELLFMRLNGITITPEGLNNLGVAVKRQNRDARDYFLKSLSLKPGYLDASRNLTNNTFLITLFPLRKS